MKEKNYDVHIMTQDEWNEAMKNCSTKSRANMAVEAKMQEYHQKLADKIGKIQDEEWMKKL